MERSEVEKLETISYKLDEILSDDILTRDFQYLLQQEYDCTQLEHYYEYQLKYEKMSTLMPIMSARIETTCVKMEQLFAEVRGLLEQEKS